METSAVPCSVGGGKADRYPVPGLQPGALRIRLQGRQVLVVAHGPAWMRGTRLRTGGPVLLSPGDEVHLTRRGSVRLVHRCEVTPAALGTRSLLRRLLAGEEAGSGLGVPRLLCIAGPELGRSLLVPQGPVLLGRGTGCGLRLLDPAIARWQARLWIEGEAVHLEDLGSYGGTRINGRRLHRTARLAPGDVIGAGRTWLRFAEAVRPPDAAPAPLAAPPRRSWGARLLAVLVLAVVSGLGARWLARPGEPLKSGAAPGRLAPPGAPPAGGGARRSW